MAITTNGGGSSEATPIASHDFGADPQASVILNDIFEAGKNYYIKGRNLARDSGTGTFTLFAFDLVDTSNTTAGTWHFLRYRQQSDAVPPLQSARTNRSAIESGLNLSTTDNKANFDIYLYSPNNDADFMFDFRFIMYATSTVVHKGYSFGGFDSKSAKLITGIKFPSGVNSPVNAGTIEVFEL